MECLERSTLAEHPPKEPFKSEETPANSMRSRGFYYNQIYGRYLMEWASPAKFEA
jgi:hypothetical protein